MALPATESFAGAAGNLSDPPWRELRTGGTGLNHIARDGSGNGTTESTSNDCIGVWDNDTFSSDHYSQVTVKFNGPGNTSQYIYIVVRASGTYETGNFYWFWSDGGSDTALLRIVGGVANQVVVATANSTTFASGDVFKLQAVGSGTSTVVTVYKNGSAIITYSDTSGSAVSGGAPGVGGWGTSKPTFDDWTGDNIAAGTTVSPGAGALTLAGQAPTSIAPIVVTPSAGALSFVGQEPQLPEHITTVGDSGTLSYVAGESLVGGIEPPQITTAQPGAGALALAGTVSTVTISSGSGTTVAPGAGALVLAGQAPTVLASSTASPGAGALVLIGQAPSLLVNVFVQPRAGALVLAGQAPSTLTPVTVAPSAGALVLAGQSPAAIVASIMQPGAGALVLAGQAPAVIQDTVRSPSAGVLVLAGQVPTLLQNSLVQPGAGALTLAGQIPAALNGDAKVAQPGAGALVLDGQAPTVLAAITAQPGAGALVLAGQAPSARVTQSAQPGAGALVLAGQTPTLSITGNVVANPLTGALVIAGLTPTAATSDNRTASPGAGALTLSGQVPVVPIPSPTVTPDPGALFLEGLAPGILVSGDDLLSAKFIARRPNVRMKGLQPEPAPAIEPLPPAVTNMPGAETVIRKARGLNLGLITAPPVAAAPEQLAVEVPPIKATMPAAEPKAVPETPPPAATPPAPEPPKPVPAATRSDVQAEIAQLHTQILEATRVQGEQMVLALGTLTARVEELQAQIEADAKARDLRERNMLRAKQIAERMLRDLEK